MVTALRLVVSVVLVVASLACGQEATRVTREGNVEILWLDRWSDPARWSPVEECTAAASEIETPHGGPALLLHFGIDHEGGEKAYPMGWPRAHLVPGESERNWSQWDRFEFDIQARTSRQALPKDALTLELGDTRPFCRPPVGLSDAGAGKGVWDTIRVPVADVATTLPGGAQAIPRIRFVVTESRYAHGDELEFHLAGFRLVRSLECHLASLAAKTPVIFARQPFLRLELRVEGPPAEVKRGVPFTIMGPDGPVRRETLPVGRGLQTLECDISELRLQPGSYELIAFEGMKGEERRVPLRVVDDPWEAK